MLVRTIVGLAGGVMHGLVGHGHRHKRPTRRGGREQNGNRRQHGAAQGVTHRSGQHVNGQAM
jgi:hypothetical protein